MNTEFASSDKSIVPSVEECREQVRRVLLSTTFHNAATLQLLLQFLTDRTLAGSAANLKEYTIGVEALGRKEDFDPKLDPIVRVQVHRVRVKLREYYDDEGSRDPIVIQFPKGHYTPTFQLMPTTRIDSQLDKPDTILQTGSSQESETTETLKRAAALVPMKRPVIIAVCAMAFLALGYWLGIWHGARRFTLTGYAIPMRHDDPVGLFWARFLGNDRTPVIAYPDAVFLLDDSNDLFWFSHGATDSRGAKVDPHVASQVSSVSAVLAQEGHLYYENGYTGTGELESIAMLTRLFGQMGVEPIVKSSRDITPDDLSQHNVILLGSPFQNPAVEQLLTSGDFSFNNLGNHRAWGSQISNARPKNGEAAAYQTERDPVSRVLLGDYSVITIAPGEVPGKRIAILGGLDTKGTQGATMFLTSEHGIEQLNRSINPLQGVPYQALIHVRLAKGYQVLGADLISVHPIVAKN